MCTIYCVVEFLELGGYNILIYWLWVYCVFYVTFSSKMTITIVTAFKLKYDYYKTHTTILHLFTFVTTKGVYLAVLT